MISRLKAFTVRMLAGGNIAVVLLMLVAGYADRINPVSYPLIACSGMAFPLFLFLNLAFLFFWLTFKFRFALIPVVGYLLVLPAIRIYLPINREQELAPGCIKVLSYNVQAYHGRPRYTDASDMIIDYIARCDADIVCLQEDMPPRPAVRKRLDSLYAYTDTVGLGGKPIRNGIGIYSRYPILRRERICYESVANGSAAYFLDVEGDTVIVINNHFESNHLTLSERENYQDLLKGELGRDTAKAESRKIVSKLAWAVSRRSLQADSVAAYIEDHLRYPIVVCGDFNDSPLSYTRHKVAGSLVDCFAETGKGLGISFNQKGFFFRIDNILCSSSIQPYNCKVDNKIDASDHYPIYCWLKFRAKDGKKR